MFIELEELYASLFGVPPLILFPGNVAQRHLLFIFDGK